MGKRGFSKLNSTAVMARRVEPHDSLDDFPTQPWATRALCEFLLTQGFDLTNLTVKEPAANRGYMVRPLSEYFGEVLPSDIFDYGLGYVCDDYLFGPTPEWVDMTFTNPPFRLAQQFVERMIESSSVACGVFVRLSFVEGIDRYERLFSKCPPTYILQFADRVPLVKGRVDSKASSATAYCWLIWLTTTKIEQTQFHWVPPSRRRLERDGDYDLFGLEAQDGLQ